ncbi:PP2C family protein-serine/threonine phosphatase (plasmid) [Streptomyces sp. BI20]|uniref:PP2C family protein-serine/threonine phosphatase n=1 Tax=Streptomyces sp. BI20 TaxID=3403460 RepID=UPI003C755135
MSTREPGDGRGRGDAEVRALRERLRTVRAAAEGIGTTLETDRTCAELARFLVDAFCDTATVDLRAEDGTPRRAARAGSDPAAGPRPAPPPHPVADAPGGEPWAVDAGHPLNRWTEGDVSCVAVPLVGGERLHGVVVGRRAGRPFDDQEAAGIHFAARLAAVRLDQARRYEAARETVLDLQRALVADPGRPHPNLEVTSRYLPAGTGALVGGDWFETVRLHFGRTLLVVGDVMGHGLDAAVDMNAYRATLRDVAGTELAPHRLLRRLDSLAAEDPARRPATCLLARIDPVRSVAVMASAGHLPPVVFDARGRGRLCEVPVGPPLGTGAGGYDSAALPFGPEDTLALFTDGLVERRSEDIEASLARLAALTPPTGPGTTLDDLLDSVLGSLDAAHAEDDVAVMAARPRPRQEAKEQAKTDPPG